ncbi:MAG: hypothetical protein GY950_10240 [bacterium]|nr:hypothetical protein [bacterium]
MAHLEAEDLARFVEGKIKKDERERFLEHFSQCGLCLKAYTDTLKIVEAERKSKFVLKFPVLEKIENTNYGQALAFLFQKKVFVPALATVLIVLLVLPWILIKNTADEILTAKIRYIEESVTELENTESYAFSQSKDKMNAAVRAGFFSEDLRAVLQDGGKEKLRIKILGMLANELKTIFKDDAQSLLSELHTAGEKTLKNVLENTRRKLESKSLAGPYQLGRFVEGTILSAFENKRPGKKEIEKYLRIVKKNNLPPGILKDLERLAVSSKIIHDREICRDIKEVFWDTR